MCDDGTGDTDRVEAVLAAFVVTTCVAALVALVWLLAGDVTSPLIATVVM